MSSTTPGIGISRLGQVSINVRDLNRAIQFYRDTLGLPLLFTAGGMAFFDCAGIRLMLARAEKPEFDHPSSMMNSRLKCNSVFREYLVRGFEAEALSGCVVVAFQEAGEAGCGQRIEVGVSGQLAAQPTKRVFDAALLPRRMGVAEPSLDAKPSAQ